MQTSIVIKRIPRNKMTSILPLVCQLNKDTAQSILKKRLANMLKNNFSCLGAYEGKKLVGIAGYWIGFRLWCGKYIDVDNFIVDESQRGKGIGKLLMQEIYKIAKAEKCEISVLDTYTQNHRSHKFYFEENYIIGGFHFYKKF